MSHLHPEDGSAHDGSIHFNQHAGGLKSSAELHADDMGHEAAQESEPPG